MTTWRVFKNLDVDAIIPNADVLVDVPRPSNLWTELRAFETEQAYHISANERSSLGDRDGPGVYIVFQEDGGRVKIIDLVAVTTYEERGETL